MSEDYIDDAINYAKLVVDLNNEVKRLNGIISNLRNQIEIQKNMPVPISVISQMAEQKEEIQKLKAEVEWLTKKVPNHILINRKEQNNSTRKGGLKR